MKNIKNVFGVLTAICLMAISYSNINVSNLDTLSSSSDNLNVIAANASVVFCDPVNENSCVVCIYRDNRIVGKAESKGIARAGAE